MKPYITREKRIVCIAGIVIIGIAFLFFTLGIMFTTYNHVQLLGNLNIDEINMNINESLIVELTYKIAQERQEISCNGLACRNYKSDSR